jgi:hypothetical protein
VPVLVAGLSLVVAFGLALIVVHRIAPSVPEPDQRGHAALSPRPAAAASQPGPSVPPGQQDAGMIGSRTVPRPFGARWLAVLSRLDAQRERAWRSGDSSALARVYTAGSAALAADGAALRGYVTRGLSVTGVTMSYFVVSAARLGPHAVRLTVVDRLGQAAARAPSGAAQRLPVDQPTRHRIVLRRVHAGWRIASITAA